MCFGCSARASRRAGKLKLLDRYGRIVCTGGKKQSRKREQLVRLMYNISTIFVHGQGRRDAAKGIIDWIIGLFFLLQFWEGKLSGVIVL